ncbi:MAG TPA: hypothetical protein VNK43_04570 [Gemmatimonadales bacterium]|nr:hypothetical protein [Gemmatimonadales bacterium]
MPSRKVLRRAARQIDAEIDFLAELAEHLRREPGAIAPAERRALAEAWAGHFRAILEFFHPSPSAPSDLVLATHYLSPRVRWSKLLPPLTRREKRRRRALQALFGPIGYRRRVRTVSWAAADYETIARRLRLFLRHLSAARRRWFPKANRRFSDQVDWLEELAMRIPSAGASPSRAGETSGLPRAQRGETIA